MKMAKVLFLPVIALDELELIVLPRIVFLSDLENDKYAKLIEKENQHIEGKRDFQ